MKKIEIGTTSLGAYYGYGYRILEVIGDDDIEIALNEDTEDVMYKGMNPNCRHVWWALQRTHLLDENGYAVGEIDPITEVKGRIYLFDVIMQYGESYRGITNARRLFYLDNEEFYDEYIKYQKTKEMLEEFGGWRALFEEMASKGLYIQSPLVVNDNGLHMVKLERYQQKYYVEG